MSDAIYAFRDAIEAAGLTPPKSIIPDGKLHRFSSNGKRGDDAGWYVFHEDGIPAGAFGCWRTGLSETWCADIGRGLTEEECRANARRMEAIKRARKAEQEHRQRAAAKRAAELWNSGVNSTSHMYLMKKRVWPYGLRLQDDLLMIPVRDEHGFLHSLQFINIDGRKKFLTGGKVAGCFHLIGDPVDVLFVSEGYATGATIHAATRQAVAVAFNAGNLAPVAAALRRKFRDVRMVICADNDHATEGNPGLTAAREAAEAVGAVVAVPECAGTDFNDLMIERGEEAVREALRAAMRRKAA